MVGSAGKTNFDNCVTSSSASTISSGHLSRRELLRTSRLCAICNVVGGASLVLFLDGSSGIFGSYSGGAGRSSSGGSYIATTSEGLVGGGIGISGIFGSDSGGGLIVKMECGADGGTSSGGGSYGTTIPEGLVGGGGGISGTLGSDSGGGVIVKTECGTDESSGGGS